MVLSLVLVTHNSARRIDRHLSMPLRPVRVGQRDRQNLPFSIEGQREGIQRQGRVFARVRPFHRHKPSIVPFTKVLEEGRPPISRDDVDHSRALVHDAG